MLLHRYIDACVFDVLIHTGMRLVGTPAARVEPNIEGATTGLASVAYILINYGYTNADVRAPMRLLVYVCASGNIQFDSIWTVTLRRSDVRLGIAFLHAHLRQQAIISNWKLWFFLLHAIAAAFGDHNKNTAKLKFNVGLDFRSIFWSVALNRFLVSIM